jgi:integrase
MSIFLYIRNDVPYNIDMSSSFRSFIRSIKNIQDDKELFTAVKQYDKTIKIKTSGVRALEALVIKNIPNLNEKTTVEMFKILNLLVPAVSSDSTTQNIYVLVRKSIKAVHGENSDIFRKAYTVLQFSRAKWRENRAIYNAKVTSRNAQKKHYDQGQIYDIMDNLPDKEGIDFVDLTICLQLACGGRVSEILSFSKFKASPLKDHIIQTGILKSKTRTQVEKPIIRYSVDKFLDLMAKMRAMIKPQLQEIKNKKISHYEFSQNNNSKINRRITKLLGEKEASHTLRKVYGFMAYQQYANKDDVSESSYLSNVLGHDLKSLDISKSYSTVSVVDKGKVPKPEEKIIEKAKDIKVPHNLKLRDGKSKERLEETVRIMRLKGLPISNKILRSYNFGAKLVGEFMKTND